MGKQGVIYKIENMVNGKVYIGQTTQGYTKRIKRHRYDLQNKRHANEHLQSAWNKYGDSNFEITLITRCGIDELDHLESYWIEWYSSLNPDYGYNKVSGGNSNKKASNETIKKMSKVTQELWQSEDFRNAIQRKVICIDTGEVFESGVEASEKMGVYLKNLYSCCSGNRDSVIGKNGKRYQFAHYEEGKEYVLKPLKSSNISKNVILVNTGEVFNGYREASNKTGVQETKIGECCRGSRETAGEMPNGERMVWVYAEDYDPKENYSFERRQKRGNNPNARKVVCTTTNKVFDCMKDAGEYYNIKNACKISLACTGKRKHVGSLPDGTKLAWAYVES